MDLLKISLEALLQRATNPQNENVDTAAVEAFCALIVKEKEGVPTGVKLIAIRMHSKSEQEALQTLHILDCCMQKCGVLFQDEIGKFRFLNEMIKLVSPKYLGCHTPMSVKQKVLQLMYLWMLDYPKQAKIKDAYDMLKKQGVIKDVPLSVSADYTLEKQHKTIFQDEEKGKLLKKLLQSKNPEDLQAANRLIKTMVKEDEKKAELKNRRIFELESVQNNIRLLNEMLDSFKKGVSSQDECDLIKELHESCTRMSPNITKLASETERNDEILNEILRVNDELRYVLEKYQFVIILEKDARGSNAKLELFDLLESKEQGKIESDANKSNVDVLCDILTTPIDTLNGDCNADGTSILKPIINACAVLDQRKANTEERSRAFDDLDALGQSLLLENLQSKTRQACFNSKDKIPMNLLPKTGNNVPQQELISKTLKVLNIDVGNLKILQRSDSHDAFSLPESVDDLLVDITTTPTSITPTLSRTISSSSCASERRDNEVANNEKVAGTSPRENGCKAKLKMGDLFVDLKDIKPSKILPVVALNENNGITLTVHFSKDKPHEDVSVFVVTIVSKHDVPIKNILFRAIVPKSCKLKLQPASAMDLPAFNPFLPATAITQVMLIANPENVNISLKFIVSYNIDDETMTEIGEIETLSAFEK